MVSGRKRLDCLTGGLSSLLLLAVGLLSASCHANELAVGGKLVGSTGGTTVSSTSNTIGSQNSVAGSDGIDVPINPVENYNFLSKEKILELRTQHVAKHPELVNGQYKPSDNVFMLIENNKPWWGMRGIFVNGCGDKSIEGEAEESRFLSNPFLLVAASPWTAEIWDTNVLPKTEPDKPDFPYCWLPKSLTYHPSRRLVEATYDVSSYDEKLENRKNWLTARDQKQLPIRTFGLVGYNARDFGYEYIYVPIDQSINIANAKEPGHPVEIGQFIHCGGGSNYPGGCNNMSPERPPLDQFNVVKLPAEVKVLLWKAKPASQQDKPDMTVLLHMQ